MKKRVEEALAVAFPADYINKRTENVVRFVKTHRKTGELQGAGVLRPQVTSRHFPLAL